MKECGNRSGFRHKILIVILFIMLFTMTKNVFRSVRVSAATFASVVYNGTESEIAGLCFDYVYYADNNEDVKEACGYNEAKLKQHWFTFGIKEGRSASPILDLKYYLENNDDLKEIFGNDYTKAYNHFCRWGYAEYRPSSKYYNGEYYRKNNKDLVSYDSKFLLSHYIRWGIYENRYANIIKYINPLKSTYNGTENEIADLCFNYMYYADNNEDVKNACGYNEAKLKQHWFTFGIKEGRSASPILDLKYYLEYNDDLKRIFGNDYIKAYNHFCQWGYAEYRASSKYYNGYYYHMKNHDLVNYDSKFLLRHYIEHGISENRYANTVKFSAPSPAPDNSSYSISNNILTINGITLSEYPIGNKYASGMYANVNGKKINMLATQCCGFARYVQQKLYGCHDKNSPNKFKDISGKIPSKNLTADKLKSLVNSAGIGAHIRTGNENKTKNHSLIIIGITDNDFTIVDANADNKLTVAVYTYTWSNYFTKRNKYGKRGIMYIKKYIG